MFALQFWDWQTCKHSNIKFWMASSGGGLVAESLYCRNHFPLPPRSFLSKFKCPLVASNRVYVKIQFRKCKIVRICYVFYCSSATEENWKLRKTDNPRFKIHCSTESRYSNVQPGRGRRQQAGQMSLCLWIDVIAILILNRRLSGKTTSTFSLNYAGPVRTRDTWCWWHVLLAHAVTITRSNVNEAIFISKL